MARAYMDNNGVFPIFVDQTDINRGDSLLLQVLIAGDSSLLQVLTTGDNAIQTQLNLAVPSGVIFPYAGSVAPSGFLLCNGDSYSKTTYSALFAILGTTYGTPSDNTKFQVPDLREVAVVGVGTSTRSESAHDTYNLGQFKDDQYQGHWHQLYWATTGSNNGKYDSSYGTNFSASAFQVRESITDGANGTPRVGTTTRGKRIGLNYIIKT
jgi:microcystin-dependent protein